MAGFSLEGRRVLVLGGSSGIGLATAQLAHAMGAAVTIGSRNAARLNAAAAAIGTATTEVLDLADAGAVAAFFAARAPFDHVAVTAAELEAGPLRGVPLARHRAAMDSKFWTAVHVAREARIAPEGSLTFVSGMVGVRPSPEATVLSAINAALDALAKALAQELAPVRVNCVSPGRTDTPWWDRLAPADRQALLDRTAQRLPVRRIGRAGDIAGQIVACMANPFMTGAVIQVDGGGAVV